MCPAPACVALERATASDTSVLWPSKFEMLDVWRGLAAIGVVLNHLKYPISIGHESVMMFFVISGYCITASAESCGRKGIGLRGFIWRRLRRIYPPYFFALLFYLVTRLAKQKLVGTNEFDWPWTAWLQNFTLTQWFSMIGHPEPQAYECPTNWIAAFWSLQYEEQFYLIMALVLPLSLWVRGTFIGIMMAVSLVWLIVAPQAYQGIFIEYWMHFGLGCVLFYRLCRITKSWARLTIDMGLLTLATVSGILWWSAAETENRYTALLGELTVTGGFAFLLILLRPLDDLISRAWWLRPLFWLGAITYSLYLTHQFCLRFADTLAAKVVPENWIVLNSLAQLAVFIAVATIFWCLCERPFLNKGLTGRSKPG